MNKYLSEKRQFFYDDQHAGGLPDSIYTWQNAPFAFVCYKIILDENDCPSDFMILEANRAFERLTGLRVKKIVNKKVSEIFPDIINDGDWIKNFGEIALNNTTRTSVETFSEALNKRFKIQAYSPQKYYLITILTEMFPDYCIPEISHTFNQYSYDTIDYQYIIDQARLLSGAKVAALNKFEKDGETFTTVAISGVAKQLKKASSILGFDIIGKKWEPDLYRAKMTKESKTSYFKSVFELSKNALLADSVFLIQKIFNLGDTFVVKTTKNNFTIGDFTLIFGRDQQLQNKNLVETYADLVGSLLVRTQAEKDLQVEHQRYMLAVNGSNDGIWDWDIKNDLCFISDKWKEQIGFTSDELPNTFKTFEKRLHPQDKSRVLTEFDNYLKGRVLIYDVEFRFLHKNGSYRWIRSKGKGVKNQEGKYYRISGSHTDITPYRELEESISTSEKNFRSFFETIGDMVFIADLKGKILDANKVSLTKLNYTKEELTKLNLFDLHLKEDISQAISIIGGLKKGEPKICPFPIVSKNNSVINAETIIRNEKWNDKDCIICVSKDLSVEQEALQKFNRIFHDNPVPMAISSVADFSFLEVNRAFLEKTEYKKEDIIGKTNCELGLFVNLEKLDSIAQGLTSKSDVKDQEVLIRTKNGTELYGIFSGHFIKSQGKEYILSVMIDITDQKVAEEKSRQADKAKSLFLANMSHELRTPLNAVIGFSDLLRHSDLDPKYLEYVKLISSSGSTLLNIVNELLDLSKIEDGKLEIVEESTDIIQLTEECADIISFELERKNIELILKISPNVPEYAIVDPTRLKQILTNLLNNAVKFTREGEIKLSLEFSENAENSDYGDFIFTIRDTGIGISEENKEKIFQTFFQSDLSTTKCYGGIGLGLTISSNLAKGMGSKIELESTLNEGSSFSFKLSKPYFRQPQNYSFKFKDVGKILIINRNLSSNTNLQNMLNSMHIESTSVQYFESDIEKLRDSSKYGIIMIEDKLIDSQDPVLFNDLYYTLIKQNASRPKLVLLASAIGSLNADNKMNGYVVDFTLRKPFKKKDVLECLDTLCYEIRNNQTENTIDAEISKHFINKS